NVSDAEQRRIDVACEAGASEECKATAERSLYAAQQALKCFEGGPDRHPQEDLPRRHASLFARNQYLRARLALGITQNSMLLHDEITPQRYHHQHAKHPAG